MSWATSIISRRVDPPKWVVVGWYEEEMNLYKTAEKEWEKLRVLGGPYKKHECGKYDLYVDDYFGWNVIHPQWYLWKDGTWNKDSVQLIGKRYIKMTEFISKVSASMALKNSVIPAEFVNYKEHLQSAAPPGNLINNSESMHNI